MLAPARKINPKLGDRIAALRHKLLGYGGAHRSEILRQLGTVQPSLIGIGGTGGPVNAADTGGLYKLLLASDEVASEEPSQQKWLEKFQSFQSLKKGWDRYDALPPSERALATAESFLEALMVFEAQPSRVAPSVVGGVGVTLRRGSRKAYFEFYNDGNACALFSDGEGEPVTHDFRTSRSGYYSVIAKARVYLNA
jgi:hypothetical protein